MSPYERMMTRVQPVTESGCWIYIGSWDGRGYGTVSSKHGEAPHKAHRLALEHNEGPLLPGEYACHKCDTPSCVNPSHLFRGDAKKNADDCSAKGRRNPKSLMNLQPGAPGHHGAGPKRKAA